jgi:hypothetical protein
MTDKSSIELPLEKELAAEKFQRLVPKMKREDLEELAVSIYRLYLGYQVTVTQVLKKWG